MPAIKINKRLKMAHYGYIRVSSDKQDAQSQRMLIYEYCESRGVVPIKIFTVKISTKRNLNERGIPELIKQLGPGDEVICTELSRLGRNMLETMNIIKNIDEAGAVVNFIRQPELSTESRLRPLLLAIYGYLAEAERDFISLRTKQGLIAAKERGAKLGRPKGSLSKSKLDGKKSYIQELLKKRVSKSSICKILEVSRPCLNNFLATRNIKF